MMFRFSVLLTVVFLTFMNISGSTKIVSAKTLRSARKAAESQRRTALVEGYSGRVIIKPSIRKVKARIKCTRLQKSWQRPHAKRIS